MNSSLTVNFETRRVSKLSRINTKELFEEWGIHGIQTDYMKARKIKNTIVKNDWEFPIKFNLEKDLKNFKSSGVMRKIEIRKISDNFDKFFYRKRTEKLITLLFWIIFCRKFPKNVVDPPDEKIKIPERLRMKISKHYTKLLYELPPPKTEVMDYIIFSSIFICYLLFYQSFVEDREQLNMVFLYEIYHICLFEINGVIISDNYISHSLELIFSAKMIEYNKEITEEGAPPKEEKENNQMLKSFTPDGVTFLGVPFSQSPENRPEVSDLGDHANFKDTLKRNLTPRAVKFEPFGNKRINTRDNIPGRMTRSKRETTILLEVSKEKAKMLKDLNSTNASVNPVKKKKVLKKKNFLSPLKGGEIDIDLIIDSSGLAGKKFHCGQVSPRIREYLGVTTGSLVNDKKEIYFHRMRKKKDLQSIDKKDYNQNPQGRMSSTLRLHKTDSHHILIEKLVRTTVRKNDLYFKNDVFNKYAFMINEEEVIKKQTKLIEDLLGNKLTLDECKTHMNNVTNNQGYLQTRILNDNEEYFNFFKKHIYRNKAKLAEANSPKPGEAPKQPIDEEPHHDVGIKSKTTIGFSPKQKRSPSPHSGSQGSLGGREAFFDFFEEHATEKATGTVERLAFKRVPESEVIIYKPNLKMYERKHSPILYGRTTDEKITGLYSDLERAKEKLDKKLVGIRARSKSPV